MATCQNVVSREPLEYCGNEDATEYDLAVPIDGEEKTGSAYFCDECEPPAEHKA